MPTLAIPATKGFNIPASGSGPDGASNQTGPADVCPKEEPICSDPDYFFVERMRSMASIMSGESITLATYCKDETLIDLQETVGGGSARHRSIMVPAGSYETTFRAPSLYSGGLVMHTLRPAVAGVGDCWIGFR